MLKFKDYLNEAKVKESNPGSFLYSFAPVFMWSPKTGLIWSTWDKKEKKWTIFENNKEKTKAVTGAKYITHKGLLRRLGYKDDYENERKFVRGRISPDGKNIMVHPTDYYIDRNFEKLRNKAVDAVYRYMGNIIK